MPDGVAGGGRSEPLQELQGNPEPLDLFELVLSRENMRLAWQQVKANKGAAGVIGWINYYGISHSYAEVRALDQWIRRRVRLCY